MAVTASQRGQVDRSEPVDPVAVAAAVDLAEREERLADEYMGHVRAEMLERLRLERDSLRSWLQTNANGPITKVTECLRLLADAETTRQRIEARAGYARMDAFVRIHEGLARLRQLKTPQELIAAAPRELMQTLGFTRAMVSRVRGSLWMPEVLEIEDGSIHEPSRSSSSWSRRRSR